jgi:hypothetical protein
MSWSLTLELAIYPRAGRVLVEVGKEKSGRKRKRKEKEEACNGACRSLAKRLWGLAVPSSVDHQHMNQMRPVQGQTNTSREHGEQIRGTQIGLKTGKRSVLESS